MGGVIIFSAPSGSGKTTIVHRIIKAFPQLVFSVSATTRPIRVGEVDGKDYFFLSVESFKDKVSEEKFLEWEEVYEGRFYGSLTAEVDKILTVGGHVVFDVDVQGGKNIKAHYGERALAIFIAPPSIETLKQRLVDRATDSASDIEKRVAKAATELEYRQYFDHVVVNDDLETAVDEVVRLVKPFIQS